LAALARGAGDRKAGNRHQLAPEGISCVLNLKIQARQLTGHKDRIIRVDGDKLALLKGLS
jgi:hypothetical protein